MKLTKCTGLIASTKHRDLIKLTGHTNLRPSIVNIGLLKSTGRAGQVMLYTHHKTFCILSSLIQKFRVQKGKKDLSKMHYQNLHFQNLQ